MGWAREGGGGGAYIGYYQIIRQCLRNKKASTCPCRLEVPPDPPPLYLSPFICHIGHHVRRESMRWIRGGGIRCIGFVTTTLLLKTNTQTGLHGIYIYLYAYR